MKIGQFLQILCLSTIPLATYATDCLETEKNVNTVIKESNFEDLMMISDNLASKVGAPKKGFYLIVENNCRLPISVAIALASWGKKTDLLSAAYYEPLYVHGWWTVESGSYLKQFFERKVTEHFSVHAHTQTGMVWGKDTIQYTIQGPDGAKVYPFLEYKSAEKCKTESGGVITCRVSYTCK